MKNIYFSFIMLIILCATNSYSQEIKGVKGFEVKPHIFNMANIPSYGDIYIGPIIRQDFNEAEPPYSPPFPPPDAISIPHMTFDKSNNSNINYAPVTGVNFEGIAQSGYIPSEPQPAAGPNHIFILGNVSVKITDKSGNTLSSVTQTAFFNIPAAEGAGFDAKCFYDYRRGRFLALCETQTSSPRACFYYLAISATNDAMGTWYVYKFDMTYDGSTSTTNWSDFPGLGISDDKLVMSGQQFSFGGNLYKYQKLRVIDRATAYTGAAVTYVDFFNWANQWFVTKPGRNMSAGNDIYIFATKYNGGTTVEFRTLTGTPASPTLSTGTNITVASYGASLSSVPGGSASNTVNTGDCRTPDFFVRNNVLYIAFHMGATISSSSVTAIKYLRIGVNPLNTTPLTDETYGAASTYYYYPMVCQDSAGTMFMGFGRSSTTEYPSSYVTGKRRTDASIQSSTLAKSGLAVTSQSRWGDYTGIDMDESAVNPGGTYAWYSGQYTKTASAFGTWVTQLSYTYGQIRGQVINDADGDVSTTGDRTPVQGATVNLKQGITTINSTTTDASGNYNFGYLETASNYSISFSPPSGKHSIDVQTGSGGNSQTKTDYKTIALDITNAQTSSGNNYIISDWLISVANGNWNSTSTWIDNTTPSASEKVIISSGNTVTVNTDFTSGSINDKGVLQFDNVSVRNITVNNSMILSNGNVTLGNNNITVGSGGSISGAGASRYFITNGTGQLKQNITNNSAYVLFPVGPSASAYNPINIQIDNSSTPDVFGVRVSGTVTNPVYQQTQIIQKEWNLTEGTAGGSNALIQFYFSSADFGTNFNPNLVPNQYDIGHWLSSLSSYEVLQGTISGPVSGLYAITSTTPLTSFSPFVVGNANSIQNPLPVELSLFNANVLYRDVKLNWTTEREINNSGFDIERKLNDGAWNKIGFVKGNNNTQSPTKYSFDDKKLNSGKYNYRLKQVDVNGNFKYYDLNSYVDIASPKNYSISQNYPNPFNPTTKIDFQIPSDSKITLIIYDITGREVVKLINNEFKKADYYSVAFNGVNLSSGVYFYRIIAGDFIMVKKMLLIK